MKYKKQGGQNVKVTSKQSLQSDPELFNNFITIIPTSYYNPLPVNNDQTALFIVHQLTNRLIAHLYNQAINQKAHTTQPQ